MPASLMLGTSWSIRELYVAPHHRRGGIANALLQHVIHNARAAGAHRVSLQTETDNIPALTLYTDIGFRPVTGLELLNLTFDPTGQDSGDLDRPVHHPVSIEDVQGCGRRHLGALHIAVRDDSIVTHAHRPDPEATRNSPPSPNVFIESFASRRRELTSVVGRRSSLCTSRRTWLCTGACTPTWLDPPDVTLRHTSSTGTLTRRWSRSRPPASVRAS
ncbi:GNAT family N-acetyltransferase [Micromonospora sp. WMMD812]|nr:GNAT family N-acetyltransferase [Micromonospora sp. WMMD812]WBB70965.1 GNAT family N-acetyltransferase [Micromonospora sp. WMMD812]